MSDYTNSYSLALKYAQKKDDVFNSSEGHNILKNGGPLIYSDWLEEEHNNKPTLANLVRTSIPEHYSEYPLQRHISTLNNDAEYQGLGTHIFNEIKQGRNNEIRRLTNNQPTVTVLGKHLDKPLRRIGIHIPNSTHDILHYLYADIPEEHVKSTIQQLKKEKVHLR